MATLSRLDIATTFITFTSRRVGTAVNRRFSSAAVLLYSRRRGTTVSFQTTPSLSYPAAVYSDRSRLFSASAPATSEAEDSDVFTKIPATISTGFLGSCKTTLLNHVLTTEHMEHGKRIAATENELGEVDIDRSHVAAKAAAAEDIVMLNNGCLCCAIRETKEDEIFNDIKLDGVVVFKARGVVNEAVEAYADRIVVNKTSLAGEPEITSVVQRMKAINSMPNLKQTKSGPLLFLSPTAAASPALFSSSISSSCWWLKRGKRGRERSVGGVMSKSQRTFSSSLSSSSSSSHPESESPTVQVASPKPKPPPPPQQPWLIVGLGNPGKKYQGTRHNVGFEMVDALAEAEGISVNSVNFKAHFGKGIIGNVPVMVAKPQTFMNASGESVGAIVSFYKVPLKQVLVIYDDLDLPFAKMRLLPKGGHGGHNGMRNIIDRFKGNRDFPRLRIGIGRPPGKMDTAAFVLRPFSKQEREELDFTFQTGIEAIRILLLEGFNKSATFVNTRKSIEQLG